MSKRTHEELSKVHLTAGTSDPASKHFNGHAALQAVYDLGAADATQTAINWGACRLKEMWDQQYAFMKLLQEKRNWPEFPTDISSKKGQKFLKDITHHVMDELFEAGQHLKNSKSHRATEVPEVDREAYKEELVDALHLFLELVIVSGITIDELFQAYMVKGGVNIARINSGY
jgi:hypothetical protein